MQDKYSSKNNLSKKKRKLFTQEEDFHLNSIMLNSPFESWDKVAQQIKGRNSKQCRERWLNYLFPLLNKEKWTLEEDLLLINKINENGTKWSVITQFFPNRSYNCIKNRWYSYLKNRSFEVIVSSMNQNISNSEKLIEKPLISWENSISLQNEYGETLKI